MSAREAHENHFYLLSENAEGSYWLRGSREDKTVFTLGENTVSQRKHEIAYTHVVHGQIRQ